MNINDYALFAMDAYIRQSSGQQVPGVPLGATVIAVSPVSTGFGAVAYRVGGEIVISYRGTDDFSADSASWPIAGGYLPDQLFDAVAFYNEIRALDSTSTISVTGHSLGGALAGVISSLYGIEATVFDALQFAQAAHNVNDLASAAQAGLITPGHPQYDIAWACWQDVYGGGTVWPPVYNLVESSHVAGEAAAVAFGAISGSDELTVPVGTSLPFPRENSLHDMQLLMILRNVPTAIQTNWDAAGKFVVTALWKAEATEAGGIDSSGRFQGSADLQLRRAIAYSTAEGPAGTSAIDAFLAAADALGGATLDGLSATLAQELANVAVGFAGAAGFSQASDGTSSAGVLNFNNGLLTLDLTDETWTVGDMAQSAAGGARDVTERALVAVGILGNDQEFADIASTIDQYIFVTSSSAFNGNVPQANEGVVVAFVATGGSDNVTGSAADDIIIGGYGNDTLDGGAGTNYLFGGEGEDTASYASWASPITLDLAGIEPSSGNGFEIDIAGSKTTFVSIEKVVLTSGDDTITTDGGLSADLEIDMGDGYDIVDFSSATEAVTLYGEVTFGSATTLKGAEQVTGSQYSDILDWSNSTDVVNLLGGDGDDTISGGSNSDWLEGGTGSDILVGGTGPDLLFGGGGNDVLNTWKGEEDHKHDGSNDDRAEGGEGFDTYQAGYGDSIYDLDGLGSVYVSGKLAGNGYAHPDFWNVPFYENNYYSDGIHFKPSSNGLYVNGVFIYGWTQGDLGIVLGGSADGSYNEISGSGDADVLEGTAADDRIRAGGGNDTIIGGHGAGNDFYDGGAGIDRITFTSTSLGIEVNLASGDAYGQETGSDRIISIENVVGGSGNDSIVGNLKNNALEGGSGNDLLDGDAGHDQLYGGAGDDLLIGGEGDDSYVYWRGDGNDVIAEAVGGGSADVLQVHGVNGFTQTVISASGQDLLITINPTSSGAGDGGSILIKDYLRMDGSYGVETIMDSAGNVWSKADIFMFLYGNNSGGLTISGTSGNDTLLGTAQADTFYGSSGNDDLSGNSGDDQLFGGTGDDVISGGAGNDWLVGEGGADTFVFSSGVGQDGIGDFEVGTDTLEIHDEGPLDFTSLLADAEEWGGNTWLHFDNGQRIVLHGVAMDELTASDFRFV